MTPPPVAASPPPTAAAAAPPKAAPPLKIAISDVPAQRLEQMDGFFRRNPGFARAEGVSDAIRGVVARIPHTDGVLDFLQPTELGYGQLIHDQMQWQINSTRQPDNPWWMRMNHQLCSDPITAEAYIRSGRESELTGHGELAWAKYIHASDKVRSALGIEPDQVYTVNKDGMRIPAAIGDAWRGASLIDRVKVQALYKTQARAALWNAHKASLEVGRAAAAKIAALVEGTQPAEAEFMSSWANVVSYYAKVNPPATGHQAIWAQKHVLPEGPMDTTKLTTARRIFTKLLAKVDHHYEDDIKGKTVDDVAKEHPDAEDPKKS